MKKILTLMLAALAVMLTACGKPGVEDVAKKVNDHEKLSQEEYSMIIDYVSESFKSIGKEIKANPRQWAEDPDMLDKKYPHLSEFIGVIFGAADPATAKMANLEPLDEANTKKAMEMEKVINDVLRSAVGGMAQPMEPASTDNNEADAAPVDSGSVDEVTVDPNAVNGNAAEAN